MVVIDQFTRRIIGFAVHSGDCDGVAHCRMFNTIISGKSLPKYLSSEYDPLFLFHRWEANLRVIDVDEIKSVPSVPTSHPFIERVIGICRQEYLNHLFFWNVNDLQRKLDIFQKYHNDTRAHSSLERQTPNETASEVTAEKKIVSLDHYRWRSHCKGLYKLPIAA